MKMKKGTKASRHIGTKGWNRFAAMLILIILTQTAAAKKLDQNAFNSGELAPTFQRNDHIKYYGGCRTLENFNVLSLGGAQRRPGTKFIATTPVGDPDLVANIILNPAPDPAKIQIYTPQELQDMQNGLTDDYEIMNDLDMSEFSYTPVGQGSGDNFTGSLDGNTFTISNLTTTTAGGVFGSTVGGSGTEVIIENIKVTNFSGSGKNGQRAAAFVGTATFTDFTDCSSTGELTAGSFKDSGGLVAEAISCDFVRCWSSVDLNGTIGYSTSGGFIGIATACTFTDCYATGDFLTPDTACGGFVGAMLSSTAQSLEGCYATGNLTRTGRVRLCGGFAGYTQENSTGNMILTRCFATGNVGGTTTNSDSNGGLVGSFEGIMSECYATGNVVGSFNLGGLTGEWSSTADGGNVTDCYATGNVTANIGTEDNIGGLIGFWETVAAQDENTLENCYSAGAVSGSTDVGGLTGQVSGSGTETTISAYWDTVTSGQAASDSGTGKTTTQMRQQATFVNWDFTDGTGEWEIVEDVSYPTLQWAVDAFVYVPIYPYDVSNDIRLIPFVHSAIVAYVVEFGNQYARFYRDGAQILDGGEPYWIITPYETDDLFEIKFIQSANWMYLTHPDYIPQKLVRTSDTTWTMSDVSLERGPFLDQNTTDVTVTPTEIGGGGIDAGASVTLAASSAIWNANHIGAHWQITHTLAADSVSGGLSGNGSSSTVAIQLSRTFDFSTHGTWTGTVTLQRSFDGSIWKDVLPVHYENDGNVTYTDIETVADATYRVTMTDYSEGTINYNLTARSFDLNGVVEITAFSSTQSVTATVENELGAATATKVWAEGAFSDDEGWPACLAFYEERLVFAATKNNPQTLWFSQTDDWEKFKIGDLADDALIYTIASDQVNAIRWMAPQKSLLLGTISAEWQFSASGQNEALTPTTRPRALRQSQYGSGDIQGIPSSNVILFAQGRRKIRELTYSFELDSWVAPDLTVLSEHITKSGIVEMEFQKIPHPILWCVRDDGEIAAMTYMREQNVVGWTRATTWTSNMTVMSEIESVAVIPGTGSTGEDEVWFAVSRVIDSNTVRYVEQMQPFDWGNDPNDMWFVDCGLSFTGGDQPSGLGHLEGETVAILADGVAQDTQVVTNGALPIDPNYSDTLTVGLPYNSKLKPMKLELPNAVTLTGATKRITDIVLRLHETLDVKVGPSWTEYDEMEFIYDENGNERDPNALFTGDLSIDFDGGHEVGGDVYIQHDDPTPCTILKMVTEFESY